MAAPIHFQLSNKVAFQRCKSYGELMFEIFRTTKPTKVFSMEL